MEKDLVDRVTEQWARQRPELDFKAMAVVARLLRMSRLLDQQLQPAFSQFNLKVGEFDVLSSLRRAGEPYTLTPTELLETMLLSSGAMTNRLDRLERAGLVTRLPDPDDRRGVLIKLTEQGLKLVNQVVEVHIANEKCLLSVLSDQEQEQLDNISRKLLASLEK
ncbi:MAG TPA: MarR family transcriptional regulator [Chloroflexia bacterium]|nr:MarR family transcriptional regulator [Chloroflexia bacterium]